MYWENWTLVKSFKGTFTCRVRKYVHLYETIDIKTNNLDRLKGNPTWLSPGIDTDVIVSETRETSRKPDEVCNNINLQCTFF